MSQQVKKHKHYIPKLVAPSVEANPCLEFHQSILCLVFTLDSPLPGVSLFPSLTDQSL